MSIPNYPYYPHTACVSCYYPGEIDFPEVIGCRACGHYPSNTVGPNSSTESSVANVPNQKRIQNTVRVDSSEYIMNVGALNVYTSPISRFQYVNWNQMSDRAVPGEVHRNVPRRTLSSSTKTSVTACRPGSTSAAGKGVDMKHGSYDRYLARLKGKSALRTQSQASAQNNIPLQGDKTLKYGIAYSNQCFTPLNC
jgi:hypothetical protein